MSEFDDLMKQKAVALKYDPKRNGAPVIVASGTQLKLGAEIPEGLYQAIVDIYIYFLGYVPEGSGKMPEEMPKERTPDNGEPGEEDAAL